MTDIILPVDVNQRVTRMNGNNFKRINTTVILKQRI
ncbi:hypothetical protein Niako_1891 [Niastella koreensis GR20-10]|uniref:Uncharacterized protein n=1 Tax=Niastella koreensis (strain DSM 17620 / KACC 11465 / NBRC 106392 / GR20-10) TaxID=700598 RepID=G8TD17_NIAKG|nr:hypothetical protein Niako_1891 [Niastella koreensis GR20-10]